MSVLGDVAILHLMSEFAASVSLVSLQIILHDVYGSEKGHQPCLRHTYRSLSHCA
ncbi:hypothetical protein HMPREF0973_01283 [Prevotella veroralis F0319]|uniref:Uncharacterized protein n=1 Tax=Prevotella veroralis F0319 TaxID=649761 RepID=C9MNU6_9BACT|nr:hypothetical protein HMPREF0973_01283 [Prevotella veroralis F0319]